MSKKSLLNSTALNLSQPESLSPLASPLPDEISETVTASEHFLSADDGDHLDGIQMDDAVSGVGGESLPHPSDVSSSDPVVPADQWISGFLGGFNLAGNFVHALKIMPEEEGKARAAAEAIYNTALDVPSLRFLIAPQGKWIGRGVAVAMFIGPKAIAAREEIRGRRSKAAAPAMASPHLAPVEGGRDEERQSF